MTPELTRRSLLGLAAAGGAGVAFGVAGAAPASAATPAVGTAAGIAGAAARSSAAPLAAAARTTTLAAAPDPGLTPFPQQDDLNFQTLTAYGEAAYQSGEVGEVASAVAAVQAAITAGGAEAIPAYQPYAASFESLAARLAAEADVELAAGRYVTARSRYLRAASYYNCVLFFVLGTDAPGREAEIYGAMQRCWAAAAALLEPVLQRVEIPATGRFRELDGSVTTRTGTITAYWGRASGTGAKPTVIINNGSDAQFVDIWAYGGAAGLERGYNVLLFEGPGQGSLLFEQNIPFTPYWEDVVTPLVDFAVAQPETDAQKVALTGWSFGGVLVMRAAAAEHRLAAVVADPGFWDNSAPWQPLVTAMNDYFGSVSNANWKELFDGTSPAYGPDGQDALKFLVNKRGEIYGSALHDQASSGGVITDIVGLLDAIDSFSGDAALFGEVTSHVLLNEYASDVFFTGQGDQVEAWLTKAASVSTHFFDYPTGTEFHCAPMAPQVRNEVVFGWLDDVLAHVPTPPTPPAPPVPPAPPAPPARPALADTGAPGAAAGVTAAIATGVAAAGAGAATLAARSHPRSTRSPE